LDVSYISNVLGENIISLLSVLQLARLLILLELIVLSYFVLRYICKKPFVSLVHFSMRLDSRNCFGVGHYRNLDFYLFLFIF